MHPAAKALLANPSRLRAIALAAASKADARSKRLIRGDRPESEFVDGREWQEIAAVLPELVEFYIAHQPKVHQ